MRYDLPTMKPRLLSVKKAAEYLGVSVRTVRRLIHDGRIPTVMVRTIRLVPFNRLRGLPPTRVYHRETRVLQVDLGKIVFTGLPSAMRKCQTKKFANGRFAPRYQWPQIERDAKRGPIQALIEDGFELPEWITRGE
jgi:excisionase family DNA binding protein